MPLLLVAESPMPDLDFGWVLVVVFRVMHIASAAVFFGGLLFIKQVLAPLSADAEDPTETLYRGNRGAWAMAVMVATSFLLLSGFYNFYAIIASNEKLPGLYHALFGTKFLLAIFVFYIAASTAGKSKLALEMQKNIGKWAKLGLAAIVVIFVLAAAMGTFQKVPLVVEQPAGAQPANPDEADQDNS